MKLNINVNFIAVLLCALLPLACGKKDSAIADQSAAGAGKVRFIKIGTGGVTGVYYPTGVAIAKMLNKKPEYRINAAVESTAGSVFNINAILNGDLDFGIASADMQFQAARGKGEWKDAGAQTALRSVFAIHPEALTLVAADDAGIKSLAELKGKHVNIGNPGSGTLAGALVALELAGLDPRRDLNTESVKPADASDLLQDDKIDAFFYVVGHPNGAVKQATAGRRKVRFIPLPHAELAAIFEKYPYYSPTKIAIAQYEQALNDADVETFGVNATLITRADVPDDVVYTIVKEVFDHLEEFKQLHEAYRDLTPESMLQGLSAPLHPGAEKYFDPLK